MLTQTADATFEPLHSLENGLILDMLNVLFYEHMTLDTRTDLDCLVKALIRQPRQQMMSAGSDKDMPHLLWKDGISNLKEMSAAYRVGIFFTIVVLSMTVEGEHFFKRALGNLALQDMQYIFEMFLCYWS